MRLDDWSTFTGYSIQPDRRPNFVVQVHYADQTLTFTKEPVGSNLTGTVLDGVISGISSGSQSVFPLDGRSQIGSMSVKLVDAGAPSTITDYIRAQLDDTLDPGESLRNNKVSVYVGFTDDFDDYVNVVTTYVNEVSILNGEYTLSCVDVSRQMRRDIFEQKQSRLAVNLAAPPSTADIEVSTVEGFAMLEHTAGFTDAPSQTVGYIRIKDTGEIIRYTGIQTSPPAFTGITREVFGTVGGAVTFDNTEAESNWPEIEEVIYLEMPAPQLAYSLLTGVVLDSSPEITLPDHWHIGVDVDEVETSEWQGIGSDLYESDTAGVFLRFLRMKKTDGKKFIESEIHRLIGTYSPVRTNGKLGLARINRVLSTSSFAARLDEGNITKNSALRHVASEVVNQYRIDYEWDGEKFLRSLSLTDADSITRNKTVKEKVLQFKGLTVSRHSESLIYSLVNSLQNRYRNSPQKIKLDVLPSLDVVEIGDILKVTLPNVPDYAGEGSLDRSFEVQSTRIDWVKGRVSLDLFGSSGKESDPLITPPTPPLADSFYTSKGTDIASIPGAVDGSGNVLIDFTLTGDADMNAAGAVFYIDGDLTVPVGRTITIEDNVQLRVKGTLTVNGTIDGNENGIAGGQPESGFISSTHAQISIYRSASGKFITNYGEIVPPARTGQYSEFPSLSVSAGATDVSGIPTDLRGSPGANGDGWRQLPAYSLLTTGGLGGASGAGLCVIHRGLVLGASALITLNGEDGSLGGTAEVGGYWVAGASGAGGGHGSFLSLTDGGAATPLIINAFQAVSGSTPYRDYAAPVVSAPGQEAFIQNLWPLYLPNSEARPLSGFFGYATSYSGTDGTEVAYSAVYIPEDA